METMAIVGYDGMGKEFRIWPLFFFFHSVSLMDANVVSEQDFAIV
jgi:hypothetical protein